MSLQYTAMRYTLAKLSLTTLRAVIPTLFLKYMYTK